jgi:membrane protein DedA with SNARE-associated domain
MDQLNALLAQHGLALVFANVLLTQLGVPLPAVPMMIVAGALVQQNEFSLAAVLAVAVAGSLLGDLPWFAAGRAYGHRVLGALCRVSIQPDSCVKRTQGIFGRWGAPSLAIAKFVPGFATLAPPLAGAMRMRMMPFLAYSAIGALLWAGAAVAGGIVFHAQVDWLVQRLAELGPIAVLVLGLVLGLYVSIKWLQRVRFMRLIRGARISVEDLRRLLESGELPLILDARAPAARTLDARRIPGAVLIDIDMPERILGPAAPEREVIVYCT